MSVSQFLLIAKDKREMSIVPYASAIVSIMYAMLSTRPNVALVISLTNRFQSNPGTDHWNAMKNILNYLRRTKDLFLVYGGCEEELAVKGYVDASLGTNLMTRNLKWDTYLC